MKNNIWMRSPIGVIGLIWADDKIRNVLLPGQEYPNLSTRESFMDSNEDPPNWVSSIITQIKSYFSRQSSTFSLDCLNYDLFTDFQKRVHHAVTSIPCGETRSYSEIASEIKSPGSARAIGNVMANNPFPIIVPCHRVVTKAGDLGGYRGGLHLKKFLLQLEQDL